MGPFKKKKGREFTSFPVHGSVQMSVHQISLGTKTHLETRYFHVEKLMFGEVHVSAHIHLTSSWWVRDSEPDFELELFHVSNRGHIEAGQLCRQ